MSYERFDTRRFESRLIIIHFILISDKLEVLEQKASNLAVGLDTNVQDFTAEYKKLEDQLADIKKVLEINYKDKDIKSLTDRVKNIG